MATWVTLPRQLLTHFSGCIIGELGSVAVNHCTLTATAMLTVFWLFGRTSSPHKPTSGWTQELEGNMVQKHISAFSDDQGNLFTSVTCNFKHQEFGYTYPELKKWLFTKDGQFNQEAYINSIHQDIERLYSTTPKAALLLKSNKKAAQEQMAAMTAENLLVENFPPALLDTVPKPVSDRAQAPLGTVSDDTFGDPAPASWQCNDYVVNVVYER
jgi:hypothetical protein